MKSRFSTLAYALAAGIIVVDQLSKWWVLETIKNWQQIENVLELRQGIQAQVLPIFNLSFILNKGVSFGMFGDGGARWILAAFSLGVAIALGVWVRKIERLGSAIAIGMIMGGALGNLIDRVRFGAVVDFLDFSGLYFPWIFNVADSAISLGVALLLLESFLTGRDDKTPAPAPER